MRTTRVLGMLAVTAAVTGAVTITAAAPAAADEDSYCSEGWVCLYENEDFNYDAGPDSDNWRNFRADKSDFRDFNWRNGLGLDSGDGMDNETSSIRNRSTRCATLYQDVGYGGATSEFEPTPNDDDGKLANDDIGDNRASAIRMSC